MTARRNSFFRVFAIFFYWAWWSLGCFSAHAEPTSPYASVPAPPQLKATSFVLMDYVSGLILATQDPDKVLEPASLTKMMTVYVVDQALKNGTLRPDELVRVSEKAWKTGGSRMFLPLGSQVPIHELMKGIIIQSGNDASVAIAEHLAGSESAFATLMNQEAARLGMTNTHFVNASGLPHPEHHTTAHDMALLAQAIIRDFPESYEVYSQKWFTFNGIKQPNRNRLLWQDSSVDGLKTGHTDNAGFCLVASATRSGMRLISVIMGTPTDSARAEESKKLLTYGFRFFETRKLYDAQTNLQEVRLWLGQEKRLPIGPAQDTYITLPPAEYKKIHMRSELPKSLTAPVKTGERIGTLKILSNEQVLSEVPLIALKDIPVGGLWRRMTDRIQLTVKQLQG